MLGEGSGGKGGGKWGEKGEGSGGKGGGKWGMPTPLSTPSKKSAVYRILPNYRTYPYKRTVKQFLSLQITDRVVLSTFS